MVSTISQAFSWSQVGRSSRGCSLVCYPVFKASENRIQARHDCPRGRQENRSLLGSTNRRWSGEPRSRFQDEGVKPPLHRERFGSQATQFPKLSDHVRLVCVA